MRNVLLYIDSLQPKANEVCSKKKKKKERNGEGGKKKKKKKKKKMKKKRDAGAFVKNGFTFPNHVALITRLYYHKVMVSRCRTHNDSSTCDIFLH